MSEREEKVASLVKRDTCYTLTPILATIYGISKSEIEEIGKFAAAVYMRRTSKKTIKEKEVKKDVVHKSNKG